MEAIKSFCMEYYTTFKFIHIFFVTIWAMSTAVAYRYYVVPAMMAWLKDPQNPVLTEYRNDMYDKFDKGVILEHIAFPVILITGIIMVWAQGWPLNSVNWLTLKLAIVTIIFIPMEIVDYHISHFKGQKSLAKEADDMELYEKRLQFHWKFFRVTAPLVRVFVPLVIFLVAVKPFS